MTLEAIKTEIQNLLSNLTDEQVLAKKVELNSKVTTILCYERFMASNEVLDAEILKRKLNTNNYDKCQKTYFF